MSTDGAEGWKKAFEYAKSTIVENSRKQGIIGREDRREIAYAGMVIKNLLIHYNQLNYKYGPLSKKKAVYLDKIYTYNFSEELAYKIIRKGIRFSELIVLEKNYIELNNRINSQAEGEREFDIDISFNTPFL